MRPRTSRPPTGRLRSGSGRLRPRLGLVAGFGLALTLALPASADEATAEARSAIDTTAQAVLEVLKEPDLTSEERRERIESIAYEQFDFETMSKLVLARDWRRLDAAQRDEFVEAFREHLSRSYGTRIERYDQVDVEVLGDRLEPRGDVTVRTRILGGEADGVAVDYRLRERGETWRVIDVVIEGVSLVSSFRDQFAEVIGREGPEGLLRRLKEKNAGDLEPPSA